jgi:hypothetical protein
MGSLWIGTRRNIRQANLEVAHAPTTTAAAPAPITATPVDQHIEAITNP